MPDETKPTIPELEPVESSAIAAMAHRGDDLFIRFKPGKGAGYGAVWKYSGVSALIFREMKNSGSVGKYFYEAVKPNFSAERMT